MMIRVTGVGGVILRFLNLFANFFDFRLNLQAQVGYCQRIFPQGRSLRQQGVCLALHLLQQKIQLLAQLTASFDEFTELRDVTAQALQLFAYIRAIGQQSRFLREPRSSDGVQLRARRAVPPGGCEARGVHGAASFDN